MHGRELVVHKKFDGEFGYKLCEPFGVDGRVEREGLVTVDDSEVTCKQCLRKMERVSVMVKG